MNSARLFSKTLLFFLGWMLASVVQAQSTTLVGPVTEKEIIENDRIFEIYIKRYQPDSTAVQYLSKMEEPVKLVVFMGSWCRESKKYIPGLMKTLNQSAAQHITVEYIGVDAQKKSPEKFLKKFNIKYIPTVVVLSEDQEVGRIVEKPQKPIELELVEILKKAEKIE